MLKNVECNVKFDVENDHFQQYVHENRNGLCDKESVVFRDIGGNDHRLRPFAVEV